MKKVAFNILLLCLLLAFQPLQLNAAKTNTAPSGLTDPSPSESKKARILLVRLNEINDMDKSELNPVEKKALRKEVRSIRYDMKNIGGGVYISFGAAILIVFLLIVLI
jgi:hypothetical protein